MLGRRTDKVSRWRHSDQKHRWVATALLDIEKGLRKINGHRHLPRLKEALAKCVGAKMSERNRKAA